MLLLSIAALKRSRPILARRFASTRDPLSRAALSRDPHSQSIRAGQADNAHDEPKLNNHDAASPSQNPKPDPHASGNPERIGFADQVGSASASASAQDNNRGSKPQGASPTQVGSKAASEEEAAAPGLVERLKQVLPFSDGANPTSSEESGSNDGKYVSSNPSPDSQPPHQDPSPASATSPSAPSQKHFKSSASEPAAYHAANRRFVHSDADRRFAQGDGNDGYPYYSGIVDATDAERAAYSSADSMYLGWIPGADGRSVMWHAYAEGIIDTPGGGDAHANAGCGPVVNLYADRIRDTPGGGVGAEEEAGDEVDAPPPAGPLYEHQDVEDHDKSGRKDQDESGRKDASDKDTGKPHPEEPVQSHLEFAQPHSDSQTTQKDVQEPQGDSHEDNAPAGHKKGSAGYGDDAKRFAV